MGGNVFKDAHGPSTGRINKADVISTVEWLENLTGLNLIDNMLGTTGKKESSGDLDLAVDAEKIDKQTLINVLLKRGIDTQSIKKSGDSVHLKTPINGNPKNGYVQTDFMFGRPEWQHFSMTGSPNGSPYKGMHRHLLLASLAKSQGLKWSYKNGLVNRETNEVVSQNPNEIAHILFNGNASDLNSVESIIKKIKSLPNYEALVAQFKGDLARDPQGPQLDNMYTESTQWFRAMENILK